jgi:hypothetical protein
VNQLQLGSMGSRAWPAHDPSEVRRPPNTFQLRKSLPAEITQSVYNPVKLLWDLVALYPQGVQWGSSEPRYIEGPVAKIKVELAKETSALSH